MISKTELEDILSYFKEFVIDKYRFAEQIKQMNIKKPYGHIVLQLTENTIDGLNYLIDFIENKYKQERNKDENILN